MPDTSHAARGEAETITFLTALTTATRLIANLDGRSISRPEMMMLPEFEELVRSSAEMSDSLDRLVEANPKMFGKGKLAKRTLKQVTDLRILSESIRSQIGLLMRNDSTSKA